MSKAFLRITRHPHTPAHEQKIAEALGVPQVFVVTEDVGKFGDDPVAQISAHMEAVAKRHDVDFWTGFEISAPGHILDRLEWALVPRYRPVMERDEAGRVKVQLDESGQPVRGPDGRDVLILSHYERV